MVKKFILSSLLLLSSVAGFGQSVELDFMIGDSVKAYATSFAVCRSFTDKMVLLVSLSKFVKADQSSNYMVTFAVATMDECSVPNNGRVLIRTADDSTIELKSATSEDSKLQADIFGHELFTHEKVKASYPVSEADLEKMFAGIKKIRMEIEPNNYEKTFSKDKVGAALKAEYGLLKDKGFRATDKEFGEDF